MRPNRTIALGCVVLLACVADSQAQITHSKVHLKIQTGDVKQLQIEKGDQATINWTSADLSIAAVYGKGYVCGIHHGTTKISAGDVVCDITVVEPRESVVTAASIKQYADDRKFKVNGRMCFGSELNGQRVSHSMEKDETEGNRIINPHPISANDREWELRDDTKAYDGAGVFMGTVVPKRARAGKKAPLSMFNFGMSKVLNDRICVYAFAVTIAPSPEVLRVADAPKRKNGNMQTSTWIPLESVVNNADLLDRIGLGEGKLPRMPLNAATYMITGGDPKEYMTESGELAIVKTLDGPVPSHYLRRSAGTVNLIYSVPGFGLGGQSLDSFLVSDGAVFRQAEGAKVFVRPTYYPKEHPNAGKVSPKTMTFLYGAVEAKGSDLVYGWIAKEALLPTKP
jgi:hypothetical protein